MQISGSYGAIGALSEMAPTQRTAREARRSGARSGDTVSISDEAKAAFRNSFMQKGEDLDDEAHDTAARFRQALEDAWNENERAEVSLMGQLKGLWSRIRT